MWCNLTTTTRLLTTIDIIVNAKTKPADVTTEPVPP